MFVNMYRRLLARIGSIPSQYQLADVYLLLESLARADEARQTQLTALIAQVEAVRVLLVAEPEDLAPAIAAITAITETVVGTNFQDGPFTVDSVLASLPDCLRKNQLSAELNQYRR